MKKQCWKKKTKFWILKLSLFSNPSILTFVLGAQKKCALVTIIHSNALEQASRKECETENYFSYFSIKTYVEGTQKNSLKEPSSNHMFKLMDKKIIEILR